MRPVMPLPAPRLARVWASRSAGRSARRLVLACGTVGAGAPQARERDEVVIEQRRAPVRERSCVRDSAGNSVCEDIRR